MSVSVDPRDFGALEQQVVQLEKSVDALAGKVDELLALANKGRGAWFAGLTSATLIGSVVTFILTWFYGR